jgi:hypothetical protein
VLWTTSSYSGGTSVPRRGTRGAYSCARCARCRSHRTTRGYSCVACLLDEVGFWATDENAAEPDIEVYNALVPTMATIPGSMLLAASSPHARRGMLWDVHRKHYGKDSPVLVWQSDTRSMNATVPQSLIDAALEADPPRASAEWLGVFRSDVEGFVDREAAQACVCSGVYERPPDRTVSTYAAFCDPSNGTTDAMTLCIGHSERQVIIIDAIREIRAPFNPQTVTDEFAQLLKSYRLNRVTGDRVGGQWCIEMFAKLGITYTPTARPKSDLYADLLALLNSRRIELLDHGRALNQLIGLERRAGRSGSRDVIDHAPGPGHFDDVINAVAGVAATLLARGSYNLAALADMGANDDGPDGARAFRMQRFMQHIAKFG